jgi:hypothetical protein
MTADADIWRSAQLLIKQHGDDAPMHAKVRSAELLAKGDLEGVRVWMAITRAVERLLASERPANAPLH